MNTVSVITSSVRSRGVVWLGVIGPAALAFVLSACQLQSAPAAAAAGTAKATRGDIMLTVGGVGRIVPAGAATDIALPSPSNAATAGATSGAASSPGAGANAVFPRVSGRLARFLVKPGQRVAAGQPLAVLDDHRTAATALGQAQTDVETALVELRQKQTNDPLRGIPPTAEEMAAAARAVTAARLRLARLLQGPRPAEVSAARLDVRRAEADLEALLGGTAAIHAQAIAIAQRNVELAQARLDQVLAGPTAAEIAGGQADVKKAEADLAVLFKPGAGTVTEELAAARAALVAAQARLAKLLGPPNPADVSAARLELERAQADLQRLQAGPSPAAISAAKQAVTAARAKLAQLLAPPLASDVAASRADVLRTEADLAVLRARGGPAAPLDVALARLKVVSAQLRLGSARGAKPLLTVRAPFGGTVTALLTVPGAPVDPLTPIATVVDLANLAVNIDLSEFDLARVKRGQGALVSVDALGGRIFPGKVAFAALTGSNTGSLVTFRVSVGLTEVRGLRPGMSVSVRIIVAKRHDVVQVPVEAVSRDDEDRALVMVIDRAGKEVSRLVKLGLSNNKNVEIVKGLRAGERVALGESDSQGGQEE
jgi:HlyD family secretion protein